MQCIQIESAQIALNLLPFCIELRYQLNFFQLCRSLGVLVFFLSLYSCVWRHLMNIPPESFLLGRCVYLYLCICIFVFVCLYLCICTCVFEYLCICVFVYFNLSDAIAPIVLHLELLLKLITSWITEVYLYFSLCLHLCICMCILICLTLLFCCFDPKSGRYGRCSQVPQPNPTSMKFHLENLTLAGISK